MRKSILESERTARGLSGSRMIPLFMNSNCLYLMSVCLLLIGTLLMMHSPILSTSPLAKNIQIYAILQLYEVLLIIICIFLMRRVRLFKDGLMLAGIEILLFLDPTFFNNVFYTIDLAIGLMVNLACFVLLIFKYAVLVRCAGLPHARRFGAILIITSLFVYFYPALLSRSMTGAVVDNFYYLFCWLPLFLVALMPPRGTLIDTVKTRAALTKRQMESFVLTIFVICNYIIISHLVESLVGYGLDFRAAYISPFLISLCFLIAKLKPRFVASTEGKQVFLFLTIIAILLSLVPAEAFAYKTILSIWLSPFRYTLAAIMVLNFSLWFSSKQKQYLFALLIWGCFLFSGGSLAALFDHIVRFRSLPYFYISGSFALLALLRKQWVYLYVAGLPLLLLALAKLLSVPATGAYFIICQIAGAWTILVLWRYKHSKRFAMSLSILSFMILYAFLRSTFHEYPEYYTLYFWSLIITSCIAAYLSQSKSLGTISLLGILGRLFYIGREQLLEFIRSGLLVMILAFITLLMGLFVSLLKRRKNIPGTG